MKIEGEVCEDWLSGRVEREVHCDLRTGLAIPPGFNQNPRMKERSVARDLGDFLIEPESPVVMPGQGQLHGPAVGPDDHKNHRVDDAQPYLEFQGRRSDKRDEKDYTKENGGIILPDCPPSSNVADLQATAP